MLFCILFYFANSISFFAEFCFWVQILFCNFSMELNKLINVKFRYLFFIVKQISKEIKKYNILSIIWFSPLYSILPNKLAFAFGRWKLLILIVTDIFIDKLWFYEQFLLFCVIFYPIQIQIKNKYLFVGISYFPSFIFLCHHLHLFCCIKIK